MRRTLSVLGALVGWLGRHARGERARSSQSTAATTNSGSRLTMAVTNIAPIQADAVIITWVAAMAIVEMNLVMLRLASSAWRISRPRSVFENSSAFAANSRAAWPLRVKIATPLPY